MDSIFDRLDSVRGVTELLSGLQDWRGAAVNSPVLNSLYSLPDICMKKSPCFNSQLYPRIGNKCYMEIGYIPKTGVLPKEYIVKFNIETVCGVATQKKEVKFICPFRKVVNKLCNGKQRTKYMSSSHEDYMCAYTELEKSIDMLSDRQKEVIELTYRQGLDIVEVSQITGRSVRQTQSTLNDAKAWICKRIKKPKNNVGNRVGKGLVGNREK